METGSIREWSGLLIEKRTEFGTAARRNRGAGGSSGVIHVLRTEYVVGLSDTPHESTLKPGTFGHEFAKTGKPVRFSVRPLCGCAQGQHAGGVVASATAANVSCAKCLKRMEGVA